MPLLGGELVPYLTQCRLGRGPTSIPSAILINPAIWPQQTWAENWGLCPFGKGELGAHLTQCSRGRAYLHAKFHLDPSKCLATIHHRHRQAGQTERTGQADNVPTVLQTVAQK